MPTFHEALTLLEHAEFLAIFKAGILFTSGFFIARLACNASKKILSRYASSQQLMVSLKVIYLSVLVLFIVAALQQLGFKLSILLGSAGIATAAIAIASQTSISNIISGLFIIMEKSFQVGDKIKVGTTLGVVSSIDLLSVKLLTANNTLIRIPNESLIKSEITNITPFETRRLDIPIKVSYEEDIGNVKEVLLDTANKNLLCLKTPAPFVAIQSIDGIDVSLLLSVWTLQKHADEVTDPLYENILSVFKAKQIHY